MSRFKMISAVMAGLLLLASSAAPLEAATKKKSSVSTKGKSKTAAKKKPSTPAPKTTDASTSAASNLDLPLPAKAALSESKPEEMPPPAKDPEKPEVDPTAKKTHPPNATVEPDSIAEFAAQSPRMQQLIRDAIDLTRLNLTYTFGSADPDSGGMDCSGTMYYLLRAHGLNDIPRDSTGQYLWARRNGSFFPVLSRSEKSEEFDQLQPGDLMFWTGTYQPARDIPVSHVMLYLGREKESGKRIMFGASDGRSYNGIQRWGVSVFDFKMPKVDLEQSDKPKAVFVGFARIPGLRGEGTPSPTQGTVATAAEATPKPKAKSKSSRSRKKK